MSHADAIERSRLRAEVARLEAIANRAERVLPEAERKALEAAQARADSAAGYLGERVSAPMLGETALEYRRRLLDGLKTHSRLATSRFDRADAATLDALENVVYKDCIEAGKTRAAPGELVEVKSRDAAGREITRHYGDIGAFLAPFAHSGIIGKFNPKAGG